MKIFISESGTMGTRKLLPVTQAKAFTRTTQFSIEKWFEKNDLVGFTGKATSKSIAAERIAFADAAYKLLNKTREGNEKFSLSDKELNQVQFKDLPRSLKLDFRNKKKAVANRSAEDDEKYGIH